MEYIKTNPWYGFCITIGGFFLTWMALLLERRDLTREILVAGGPFIALMGLIILAQARLRNQLIDMGKRIDRLEKKS